MSSITYIGMDVHTSNYTLCCYTINSDRTFAETTVAPDYKNIIKYVERIRSQTGSDGFLLGYEAGYLGYSLYHQLTDAGYECVILAPTTMPQRKRNEPKTDIRDARAIARCLAFNTYSPVYVPDDEDNSIKEYIRLRDSKKAVVKTIKQQLVAFCARYGMIYQGKSKWTNVYINWLKSLKFGNPVLQKAFDDLLIEYSQATEKLRYYDEQIDEFSKTERYAENVKKLRCFIGIETHTAMALLSETGDFKRFRTANQYASYLGLVPGEHSSGNSRILTGITKAGNTHLRRLLTESAQCYTRGMPGTKSKTLRMKQHGNSSEVIAYADRANERLRRKFRRIMTTSNRNIAVTAIARELACFVWGLMTENIS